MLRKIVFALILLFLVNLLFFSPFYLQGRLPFPGDLLLAEYNPWRQYSFFGFAPGAVPHKAQSFDTLCQLYPWRYLAVQLFKQGKWPLWNPYNFSGTPLLANFQIAAFYPLNFLYFLPAGRQGFLDFNLAWAIQVVLQPLLASFFFFLLARRLKISFAGSLLGAVAFGYSSFMTVWLEYNTIGHVILWLPLILWVVEIIREKTSFFRASLLAWTLTFSFLAGHLQDFAMVWLFSLIYFVFRERRKRRLIFLWFLPFFLGAIQLLAGMELIFNSARSPLPKDFLLTKVLLQPWQLIFALVPDFFGNPATRNYFLADTYIGKVLYIGLLPLVFALIALQGKKNWQVRFFGSSALISVFLATLTPLSSLIYSLPIFSSLSPTRVLFLGQFSLALLAGFGFDSWQKKKTKHWLSVLGGVGLVFLVSWIFASGKLGLVGEKFLANLLVVRRNLLYSTILFFLAAALLLLGSKKKLFTWLMIVFIVLDLFRFFKKITPFSPPEFIFPQVEIFDFLKDKQERFWGYGTASVSPNYNLIYQLYSPEGYDPLYPRWYGEFIRLSEDGQLKPAIRSNAAIAPGFGRTNFAENKHRQRVLEMLSVKYILDRVENQTDETTFPPEDFPLIWQDQGWRIYENKKALPRAFLISAEKKIEKKAEIVEYQPNLVRISITSPMAQTLVLTDNYYPGWQAFIDGESVPIYRNSHTLRAITVPSGKHQVEFTYFPPTFRWGLWLSSLTLGGWLFCLSFSIIRRRK